MLIISDHLRHFWYESGVILEEITKINTKNFRERKREIYVINYLLYMYIWSWHLAFQAGR